MLSVTLCGDTDAKPVRRYDGLDYLEKPIDEARLLAAVEEGAN